MGILLIEPAIVPAIYCSGIAEPEDLQDGNVLFTGFARQRVFHGDGGSIEYVIVNRTIMPLPAVLLSMRQTVRALGLACFCANHVRLVH